MAILLDSSEILEAARLVGDLLGTGTPVREAAKECVVPQVAAPPLPAPQSLPEATTPPPPPPAADLEALRYREEKLDQTLAAMCRRGNFTGAVVADNKGFLLAVHNSPVESDAIAAFTSVLGEALEKAGRFLGEHGADSISMDINYTDKLALRRFRIGEIPYFLMVLCPQEIDEKGEVELSLEQIVAILTAA